MAVMVYHCSHMKPYVWVGVVLNQAYSDYWWTFLWSSYASVSLVQEICQIQRKAQYLGWLVTYVSGRLWLFKWIRTLGFLKINWICVYLGCVRTVQFSSAIKVSTPFTLNIQTPSLLTILIRMREILPSNFDFILRVALAICIYRSCANHKSNMGIKPNPEAEVTTKTVYIVVVSRASGIE